MKRLHLSLVLALAAPTLGACLVHGQGSMTVSTGVVVDVYQEPPPPRPDTPTVERAGFVWVKGRWTWRANKWEWIDGHWERARANMVWVEGRWEKRGTSWHWIEGEWRAGGAVVVTPQPDSGPIVRDHRDPVVTPPPDSGPVVRDHRGGGGAEVVISVTPNIEPPPLRVDAHDATRAGFIWITGRWTWVNGKWDWTAGHWERERANQRWVDGRWERQGSTWVWVEGTWEKAPAGPTVRDHRH